MELEKGTTSRQSWLSDVDLRILDFMRDEANQPLEPPSTSLLMRLSLRSIGYRLMTGRLSIKEIVAEATLAPKELEVKKV
jgi:hypothetical protein